MVTTGKKKKKKKVVRSLGPFGKRIRAGPSAAQALISHAQTFSSQPSYSRIKGLKGASTMNTSFSTICRRVGLKEIISSSPVYTGAIEESGGLSWLFRRWATKKTAGSTKNGRDSKPKNLGVKKFGGERVIPGNIIVRQRGTRFHPGDYVGMGKDHTLYALKEGQVRFERHKLSGRKWVHVNPKEGHVLHPVYTTTADVVDGSQLC